MKDFYYILGLDSNCTLDEIKDAYRKLSKKFHPDLNQGDKYFENRFREIKEAYETLFDPGKRLRYDAELKKSRSDTTGEEAYKKQQYYREQTAYQQYQARPSAFQRPKTKSPGIGMTVALILIALVIGVYMVESFSSSKTRKVTMTSVVSPVPLKTHKHHRKKHSLENKIAIDSSKPISAITSVSPVKPVHDKQPLEINNKQPQVVNAKQLAPTVNNNTNQNFLYATYVRPNITGVINMRRFNDYGSDVIERIPANSKVFVIEKGNTYYKVSFNNDIGYVPKWSLQTK
jgi:curved DNA-binding protein CbpA